jgi:hypothetical protein
VQDLEYYGNGYHYGSRSLRIISRVLSFVFLGKIARLIAKTVALARKGLVLGDRPFVNRPEIPQNDHQIYFAASKFVNGIQYALCIIIRQIPWL